MTITKPDGTVVESGDAVILLNGVEWEYTAKVANVNCLGDMIKITATDNPGNTASLEQTI